MAPGTMMKKKFLISLCFVIIICILVINNDNNIILRMTPFMVSTIDHTFCYFNPPTLNATQSLRVEGDRNIFFHETSCFVNKDIVLNPRQACAVESAAKMNPTMNIYLILLSHSNYSMQTDNFIKHLTSYRNIFIRHIYMEEYVKNTPLQGWWGSDILESSRWQKSHMSDIMRYLTLWKYSGIYLDLDVVVTSSLEKLTNFAGAEDWEDVAAGVMGFDATVLGRRFADACLRDLKKNFRGDIWGNNGPGVITRTLQRICATKYARDMTAARCHGFTVYPPSAFYPIHYKVWKQYFTLNNSNETLNVTKNALAIHVWNKLSQFESIQVGSEVPYAKIASKYCPKIYNNCGEIF